MSSKEFLKCRTMGLSLCGHVFLVMYLLWLLGVAVGSGGKVTGRATCYSTGLGEPARVTCHYSQNVAEAGDISVVWLLHDTEVNQEKVVECHRYFDKEFDCLRKAGYSIMGTISDLLVIKIPNARPEHQGIYSCQIGTQQTPFNYIDSCILAYKVSDDASAPPPEQKSDDHQKEVEGTSYFTAFIITTIVLSVLWAALLVVLIVLRRRRRRCNRRQQDTDAGKLKDETGSFLQASNNGDGNGPRTMNVAHFVRNLTEDTVLLTGVSTRDNVEVVATPPYSSEIYSAAERTLSVTEDNYRHGDYKSRWLAYNGDLEKSRADTNPGLHYPLNSMRAALGPGDRRGRSFSDFLKDCTGIKMTSGRYRSKSTQK